MIEATLEKTKLEVAMLKAIELMQANGLGSWKIDINNKRSSLAETYYRTQTIMFSKHFVLVSSQEQFVGVTYHEIAHAILGKGHGHDKEFKDLCAKISPNADYAQRSVDIGNPIRKFILECPDCGYSGSTNSKKTRYCANCWKEKKEMVAFVKKENELKVKMW